MKKSKAKAKLDTRDGIIAWSLIVLVVVIFGSAIGYFVMQPPPPDKTSLCPAGGPTGHVVLLVDKTDPLTFTQNKAFLQLVEDFASGKIAREGELLSVFVLGEDYKETPDPVFEKCNPGDGAGKSELTTSPHLLKKIFDENFRMPLLSLPDKLTATSSAKRSPILEMLQLVALRFDRHASAGPKRLYVVSDMLHNTEEYSLFRDPIDYPSLKRRASFAKLKANLSAVDTTILYLLFKPELQTMRLNKFWEDYFTETGARLVRIDVIPG